MFCMELNDSSVRACKSYKGEHLMCIKGTVKLGGCSLPENLFGRYLR